MYPQMNQNIMAMLGQNGGFSPMSTGGMPPIRGTAMGSSSGFIPPPPPPPQQMSGVQPNSVGGAPQSPMVNMPMPPQTGGITPQQTGTTINQPQPQTNSITPNQSQQRPFSSFDPKSSFGMFR